jgi:tRNA(fMet)-specific endonuclease VapC
MPPNVAHFLGGVRLNFKLMQGYLLDTNIVIAYLKKDRIVRQRIYQAETSGYPVMLSAISYYETLRGFHVLHAPTQQLRFEQLWKSNGILMIDQKTLDKASEIYAGLRSAGQLIEDADILAAAVAIANDYVLITHNTLHFARVSDLQIEDWLSL